MGNLRNAIAHSHNAMGDPYRSPNGNVSGYERSIRNALARAIKRAHRINKLDHPKLYSKSLSKCEEILEELTADSGQRTADGGRNQPDLNNFITIGTDWHGTDTINGVPTGMTRRHDDTPSTSLQNDDLRLVNPQGVYDDHPPCETCTERLCFGCGVYVSEFGR